MPLGLVVFSAGILYMVFVGRHLLPARQSPQDQKAATQLRPYISEAKVLDDSKLAGKTLFESRLGADYDLTVIGIVRGNKKKTTLHRNTQIDARDVLLIESSVDRLMQAQTDLGLSIASENSRAPEDMDRNDIHIFEATLAPRSSMIGRSPASTAFRDRYGFTVLAIRRHGEMITKRLRDVTLRFGDALLLQGPRDRFPALQQGNDFLILESIKVPKDMRNKIPVSIAILVSVILSVVFANLDIALAMVIGAVAMVLTGCLTIEEAHESIDWRTVFLVAGMLPLGIAMETTGTARYIADWMLNTIGGWGPVAALGAVYLLAAVVTQPMSNAAAMVLVVPIALDTALTLGANHLTFTLAVVVGGVTSFLTPVGHKANVLVFGPGGYKFFDYARVGFLLTVVLFIVTMLTLPIIFPLFP